MTIRFGKVPPQAPEPFDRPVLDRAMAEALQVDRLDRHLADIAPCEASSPTFQGGAVGVRGTAAAVLVTGDLVTYLVAWLLLLPMGSASDAAMGVLGISATGALAAYYSKGLYPGYGILSYELLRRRCTATAAVAAVVALAAAALLNSWQIPVLALAMLGIALVLQPAVRAILRECLRRADRWGDFAVILGDPLHAEAVEAFLQENWKYGFRAQAQNRIDSIVRPDIALIAGNVPDAAALDLVRQKFSEVVILARLPGVTPHSFRPTDTRGEIGLRLQTTATQAMRTTPIGRAADIAVASLTLIVALPVVLAASAAIYVVDPGPVFYRQPREGLGGRTFAILKLRSMYRDSDSRLETLLKRDPTVRAEWGTHFKIKRDPRILPIIGKFLRSSSIDELPQLINVIRGDMRIVGPRPLPLYHLSAMDSAFRVKRRSVAPGLTGLWQASERSDASVERQQELDGFYIDNRSFWLDLYILLITVRAVCRGDGAY
jgi:lipopolysaccharide/colanic/teichoic acid biosynthesis glycosyltransferase